MQRIIIGLGILLILVGLLWPLIKKSGLGHLPGDLLIKKGNFTFYFPLTTSIIISLIIMIILWLMNR
ncbi:Protein of uncharacterised function (DUF2905) [Legionella beliardensis]|uniref:Protein of uncharacterized function (DUF2905) n=1 Tax=Legionella beliardensis TaxID=91822 RepID=A0A378HXP2_9GAMM|nr:DUF2905 domain-containing protein [Legionella beliardensis]STX27592.1 Protein of uncharacterised function (DUF2905) [Legionella beliardensis]